jgi:hypothetical protein
MRAAVLLLSVAVSCGAPPADAPPIAADSVAAVARLTSDEVIVLGTARPVDDAPRHPEFAAFRDSLLGIVERRDTLALFALLTPEVKLSHGGDYGLEGLRTIWEFDQPGTQLWAVLDDVLHHGAVMWSDSAFVAPYTNTALPDSLDPFEHLIVRDTNVMVFITPDTSSTPIARLDYAIVRAGDFHAEPAWRTVRLTDGRSAYVRDEHIRSPIDHRIYFERIAGRWMITVFLAGD